MDDNKKYIIIPNDSQLINGITVYRIKALRDIYPTRNDCHKIRKGSLGGYIQSEKNLDQLGECWIYNGSFVMHQAVVKDNAQVTEYSSISLGTVIEDNARVTNSALHHNCRVSHSATVENSSLSNNIWLFDDVAINNIHTSTPALYGRHYRQQRVQGFVEAIVDAIGYNLSIQDAQKAINTLVMKWLKEQAGSRTRNQYDIEQILSYLYSNAAELMQGYPVGDTSLAQAVAMHSVLPTEFDHILSWILFDPKELIRRSDSSSMNLTDALVIHYLNHPNCILGERLRMWHEQIFHYQPKAYKESTLSISHSLMTHYLTSILISGRKRRIRSLSIDFSDAEKRLLESGDMMPIMCRLPDFMVSNAQWFRVAYEVLVSTQTTIDLQAMPDSNTVTPPLLNRELHSQRSETSSLRKILAPLRGTDAAPVYRVTGHNSTGQKRSKLEL
jgi:hypothetical protein